MPTFNSNKDVVIHFRCGHCGGTHYDFQTLKYFKEAFNLLHLLCCCCFYLLMCVYNIILDFFFLRL